MEIEKKVQEIERGIITQDIDEDDAGKIKKIFSTKSSKFFFKASNVHRNLIISMIIIVIQEPIVQIEMIFVMILNTILPSNFLLTKNFLIFVSLLDEIIGDLRVVIITIVEVVVVEIILNKINIIQQIIVNNIIFVYHEIIVIQIIDHPMKDVIHHCKQQMKSPYVIND